MKEGRRSSKNGTELQKIGLQLLGLRERKLEGKEIQR